MKTAWILASWHFQRCSKLTSCSDGKLSEATAAALRTHSPVFVRKPEDFSRCIHRIRPSADRNDEILHPQRYGPPLDFRLACYY